MSAFVGVYFDIVILVDGYERIQLRTEYKGGSEVKFEHRIYPDLSSGHY